MSNRYLSQEEIDAILKYGVKGEESSLSSMESDALGEVANISMGTAATTLSQLLNQRVTITTPRVKVMSRQELFEQFAVPYMAVLVKFTEGLSGFNLLVMRNNDAKIIADILMGGQGVAVAGELNEIQISAVCEVMNQMIGTAATSMHSMFGRKVNITPPEVVILDHPPESSQYPQISEETLVIVFFRMVIGDLIDSEIMQIMPLQSAKDQVGILMGSADAYTSPPPPPAPEPPPPAPAPTAAPPPSPSPPPPQQAPAQTSNVTVQRAEFSPFPEAPSQSRPGNIDLILDVSLQVSVVLGKSRKSIKDILMLGPGSVVELDRMVEDQVDVLVNGTLIARGEIVVVNESFGVRLTSILSPQERIKELAKGG
jgi:flagellar motor switch protein FliN/FliY